MIFCFCCFSFEAEISSSSTMFVPNQVRPVIAANTYSQVQQKLNRQPQSISVPPPPMPPPAFIQSFVPSSNSNIDAGKTSTTSVSYPAEPSPVVLSGAPKLYTRPVEMPLVSTTAPQIDISAIQFDVTQKLKKLKAEKSGPNPIAEEAIKAAKASSALQSFQVTERRKKDRKTIRIAGGQVWEDPSLADWPDDDFRIFCGDLGNDVNDEVLTRTFNKYPSFQRARVIRDKRTGKSKGFGFVSFREPQDFIRAMKEMDGKFILKEKKLKILEKNIEKKLHCIFVITSQQH